jgi:1-deoxy-D-xylulose-5-phosphate reductoisomerase
VAVQAFLEERIPFIAIAEVIQRVLDALPAEPLRHFSDLYGADAAARERARELLEVVAA